MPDWTFETLAQTDGATLEKVLRAATAPDLNELVGYTYCGWNHDLLGRLAGEKFKKGFYREDGAVFGYNDFVLQDRNGYRGEWQVRTKNGEPVRQGYFRVSPVKDNPPRSFAGPYVHLIQFDYNVPMNRGMYRVARTICDFVGLPNPGDHELLLGKAYLRVLPGIAVFASYFVLGCRERTTSGG
jgi:hypothetical protein